MQVRVLISIVSASIFYFVWLALFLLSVQLDFDFAEAIVWTLAPAVTAAGFTLGLLFVRRRTGGATGGGASFLAIYLWPLTGCVLGTAMVFWMGAMFIFAGMLVGGTAAIILRELLLGGRRT